MFLSYDDSVEVIQQYNTVASMLLSINSCLVIMSLRFAVITCIRKHFAIAIILGEEEGKNNFEHKREGEK